MSEAAYYDHAAGHESDEIVRQRLLANADDIERLSAIVAAIPDGARSLLDVGCGFGLLLNMLREERPELRAVGIERSEPIRATGERLFGIDSLRASADAIPFGDMDFDVVTACEVLEHLPCGTYEAALKELQRVARSTIIVSVPFEELRQFAICPSCRCHFDPSYHMREFNEQEVRNLFRSFVATSVTRLCWRRRPSFLRLRAWLRELTGKGGFPAYGVCPQCGYRNLQPASVAQQARPQRSWLVRMARRIVACVPQRTHPCWALAVFRRQTVVSQSDG